MRAAAVLLGFTALAVWAQTCLVCGEIRSIREVHGGRETEATARTTPGSPQGLDTAPVVGTVAQFHFGGKTESWTFGAAGTPEMQARLGETTYEVTVAMDMGERRVLQRRDGNRFHVGQRVALRSGELEPM
jgi:outer membrane lipoprotein SlyB